MKKWIGILFLICPALGLAETVEEIVATVNGQIILLSDLTRNEIFLNQALPLEEQIEEQIGHLLLLNEAKRFIVEPPSHDEVNRAVDTLTRRFKNKKEFEQTLRDRGMNREELRAWVTDRLWVKTFLHDRIGFFIFISNEEVDRYAREHPTAFPGPATPEKNSQIEALLKMEKEKIKTREYLEQLRSRATLRIHQR